VAFLVDVSIDKKVLKYIKIEEIRAELSFHMLQNTSLKDELVDILLSDNERVIADGIQKNRIVARKNAMKTLAK